MRFSVLFLLIDNDRIIIQARQRYGIRDFELEPLDGFESFMYLFRKGDAEFILRIAHSLRRSANMIRGELDWINHLHHGGVSAARAVTSVNNKLVEVSADGQGGQFLATAFVKAPGSPPGGLPRPS